MYGCKLSCDETAECYHVKGFCGCTTFFHYFRAKSVADAYVQFLNEFLTKNLSENTKKSIVVDYIESPMDDYTGERTMTEYCKHDYRTGEDTTDLRVLVDTYVRLIFSGVEYYRMQMHQRICDKLGLDRQETKKITDNIDINAFLNCSGGIDEHKVSDWLYEKLMGMAEDKAPRNL